MGDMMPELALGQLDAIEVDPRSNADLEPLKELAEPSIVTVKNGLDMEPVHAFRLLASRIEDRHLILLKDTLAPGSVSGEDGRWWPPGMWAPCCATGLGTLCWCRESPIRGWLPSWPLISCRPPGCG